MITHPTYDAMRKALSEARAEIERLTRERDACLTTCAAYRRTMAAEAERDALREALAALVDAPREYGDMLPSRLWDAARAELAKTERDALREALPQWRPISETPPAPMMVVYWLGEVASAADWPTGICGENGRDERYDLGFWDGEWCYAHSGHAVFEFEAPGETIDTPTHWAPLLPAALAKTEGGE